MSQLSLKTCALGVFSIYVLAVFYTGKGARASVVSEHLIVCTAREALVSPREHTPISLPPGRADESENGESHQIKAIAMSFSTVIQRREEVDFVSIIEYGG